MPDIDPAPGMDFIRKVNALISGHLHVPNPEELPDEVWVEKYRQVVWYLDFESRRYNLKEGQKLEI